MSSKNNFENNIQVKMKIILYLPYFISLLRKTFVMITVICINLSVQANCEIFDNVQQN